jgi:hypothetical protein
MAEELASLEGSDTFRFPSEPAISAPAGKAITIASNALPIIKLDLVICIGPFHVPLSRLLPALKRRWRKILPITIGCRSKNRILTMLVIIDWICFGKP